MFLIIINYIINIIIYIYIQRHSQVSQARCGDTELVVVTDIIYPPLF